MANLAIIEKIEAVAVSHKSRFMVALKDSMPQGCGILPAAMVRGALSAIKNSPQLQGCSEYSLFTSIAEVAQTGLSLDVHLGQAYLVPFSGVATVMYGYRGLCELARRSGEVTEIVGELRYAKDQWRISLGTRRELFHVPLDAPPSKRGAILGAYAVAELLHGQPVFEYMTIEEIEKISSAVLKRAKGKPSPWETNPEEMMRKTPIRRISKRLPQSPSLIPFVQSALRDEYRQAGIINVADITPAVAQVLDAENIEPPPPASEPKSQIKEEKSDDKITDSQAKDVYTLISDCKLESTDMPKLLAAVGHKGKLVTLPKEKLAALHEKIQAFKRA